MLYHRPSTSSPRTPPRAPRPLSSSAVPPVLALSSSAAVASPPSVFSRLRPLRLCHVNTRECLTARLYDAAGRVDVVTARKLDELVGDFRDETLEVKTMDRRLFQLVFKAAYHFQVDAVDVVSGYRKARRQREGPHGAGTAMDFKLPSIPAAKLASYLRKSPRVGIGVYTHPRTQYVHLDVRAQSYHWIDASPPHRTWRERSLRSSGLQKLDAAYTPRSDWPEEALAEPGVDGAGVSPRASGPE